MLGAGDPVCLNRDLFIKFVKGEILSFA